MQSRTLLIAIVFAAIAGSASSETSRAALGDPALDALVAKALANAPELASARAQSEAARRRIEPAATLPDPTASLRWDGDRRMVSVMASQAFPWPGKLETYKRAAEAEAAVVEAGLSGRAALTIEARVRNAWYDLGQARAVEKLIEERKAVAKNIVDVARQRYAAGLTVQQDVLRAQLELARLDEASLAQQAIVAARLAELNALAGNPADTAIATPELPAANVPMVAGELLKAAIDRNPELATAALQIEAARTGVDAAKAGLKPDFVLGAGPMIGSMSTALEVTAGISLPLYRNRKQKNEIAAANAAVTARSADVEAIRRDVEIRTRERIASLEAATKTAALYRDQLLPLDELSYESALNSYQAGKLPFIGVLEALNTLYSDRAALAARIAESAKWRVAIDESSLGATAMTAAPAATSSQKPATAAMGM